MSDKRTSLTERVRPPASIAEEGLPGLIRAYVRAGLSFLEDDGTLLAASVAYYSLLSAVPLLLALASIAAFFIDQQWALRQATILMREYVPQGTSQLRDIVQQAIAERERVGLISLLTFIWSGSRVFSALTRALNTALNVEEPYGFLRRTLLEFAMTITIGLFFIVAVVSSIVINLLVDILNLLPDGQEQLSLALTEIVSAVLLLVAFFLIYKLVPRRQVGWRAAVVGAITATVLFALARPLFLGYVGRFANFQTVYGPLAIVIVLVFWAWLVAVILLYGGEVTAQFEEIFQNDRLKE